MTPIARRVMEKVRQRDHGTYERWIGAIVDATLDEAEMAAKGDQASATEYYRGRVHAAESIRSMKEPT